MVSVVSGYTDGKTKNPTYEQVSSGATGHTEAVEVKFDPAKVSYEQLLDVFWINHDPTCGTAQFCDHGTQYRPGYLLARRGAEKGGRGLEGEVRQAEAALQGTDRRRDRHGVRLLSRGGIPPGYYRRIRCTTSFTPPAAGATRGWTNSGASCANSCAMTDRYIAVRVQKDLEELIPTYMANRAKEIATLRTLLAAGDYEQLGRVGHRMRGVGEPYGFDKVSALGKLIQDCAETRDHIGLERCVNEYADYLARVRIVYM